MSEVTTVPLRPVARGTLTRVWLGVAAAALLGGGLAIAGTSRTLATTGTAEQFLAWHQKQAGIVTTPSGLQYQVIAKGSGPKPTDQDVALVGYKGTLRDGTVFDENPRAPFPVGQVVPGFSEGLKLMSKGAKYRFWMPPALGYGAQSPDEKIPPNSVLVFDVELIDFRSMADLQRQIRGTMPPQGAQ